MSTNHPVLDIRIKSNSDETGKIVDLPMDVAMFLRMLLDAVEAPNIKAIIPDVSGSYARFYKASADRTPEDSGDLFIEVFERGNHGGFSRFTLEVGTLKGICRAYGETSVKNPDAYGVVSTTFGHDCNSGVAMMPWAEIAQVYNEVFPTR